MGCDDMTELRADRTEQPSRLRGKLGNRIGRQLVAAAIAVTLSSAGCAKQPELVSVSAVMFNYSDEYLVDLTIGDKQAGSLGKPDKLGEVRGGGKVICCISLSPKWKTVEVAVRAAKQDQVGFAYVVNAEIRQPWPEIASYAVFHVLPGHKIVIELVSTRVEPDLELLAKRIRELRLRP
jgi:hypothetical protein